MSGVRQYPFAGDCGGIYFPQPRRTGRNGDRCGCKMRETGVHKCRRCDETLYRPGEEGMGSMTVLDAMIARNPKPEAP